ncbi:MAG: hypothetical protein ACJ768_04225 [Gaiellaceae bacterium]
MVAAVTMLAAFVPGASARTFSVDENGFRAVWSSLEFQSESITTIGCPMTLEGTFTGRTIAKRLDAIVGRVIRADVRGGLAAGECTGGNFRANTETLPWDITYKGFEGTLPNITGIRIDIIRIVYEIDSLDFLIPKCRSTTSLTEPASGTIRVIKEASGLLKFEMLTADSTRRIVCRDPFEFNVRFSFRGEASVARRGSTTRILVNLI